MTTAPQLPPKKTPPLTPPGPEANVVTGSTKNLIILLLVIFFLTIGILIYGVLFFLPNKDAVIPAPSSSTTKEVSTTLQTPAQKPNEVTQEESEEEFTQKSHAQEVLRKFLELQNSFERENISAWGGQEYMTILTLIAKGDAHLFKKEYVSSEKAYSEATSQLKDLYDHKSIIFQKAMAEGSLQLNEKNSVLAGDAFTIALAIDPDNNLAKLGLKRAQNLDSVVELFVLGREYEENGDLVSAFNAYQEAHNLDGLFEPATVGLHRVEKILKNQELSTSLSSFYAALKRNRLDQAEAALSKATAIYPGDPAVIGASEAFRQAKKNQTVASLRIKAEKLSHFEEWKKALDTYSKVLKIAPRADFALRGLEIARKNAALNDRLDVILKNPQQLQNENILQNAEETLKYATGQPDLGPKIKAKIADLEVVIKQARTSIKLTLFSDNMTAVAIYHVGRLGTFFQKELVLKPGRYTIVGERPGYRDVRHIVTLTHEHPTVEFSIACKEAF